MKFFFQLRSAAKKRGVSLVVVLVVSTIAFLTLGGVWQIELYQVTQSRVRNGQTVAQNLTDGAVSMAIAKLKKDPKFGADPGTPLLSLDTAAVTDFETEAFICFDPKDPKLKSFKNPQRLVSVNNLAKDTSVEGPDGFPVEAGQALLIGVAKVGENYYASNVRVNYPTFPYALATAGAFQSFGALTVGGFSEGSDLAHLDFSKLKAGGLLANSDQQNAISLSGVATIAGDAKTQGTADVSGAKIEWLDGGKLETKAASEEIPKIALAAYDVAARPEHQTLIPADFRATNVGKPLVLSGLARSSGNQVLTGGLVLNSAVLFHDGDLVIDYGGITGSGALFVTGKLEVRGQNELATTALCAIVAKQGLTLKGNGIARSSIHGLIYSEGPIAVQDVTVIGTLINGKSDTSASPPPMQLTNSAFLRDEAALKLEIDLQFGGTSSGTPLGMGGDSAMILPPASADATSGFGPLRYLDPKTGKLLPAFTSNKPDPVENAAEVKAKLQTAIEKDLTDNVKFRRGSEMVSFKGLSKTEQEAVGRTITGKASTYAQTALTWIAKAQQNPPYKLTLDLNQFVKVQSRLKVVGRQMIRVQ